LNSPGKGLERPPLGFRHVCHFTPAGRRPFVVRPTMISATSSQSLFPRRRRVIPYMIRGRWRVTCSKHLG
jgi:hypothetical protein